MVLPLVSPLECFFSLQRYQGWRESFVVAEGRLFNRVEFSVFILQALLIPVRHFVHMLYYFYRQLLVFGFGILPVENRVIGFTEPHASEDMLRVVTVLGVLNILAFHRENSEAVELGVVAHETLIAFGRAPGHG